MKKKVIIISSIALVLLVILIGIFALTKKDKPSLNQDKFDNKIVSILTIDVNPSMEINLNKNHVVVSIVALNDDAKEIVNNINYEKENIENVLSTLVSSLKQNNYLTNQDNLILINVDSKDTDLITIVQNKVSESLDQNSVVGEVIMQQVKETSELKEIAKKNNITISKAYYIQEQIKDEEGLSIEDLKDIPLNEIKTKVEEYIEEQEKTKEEPQGNTNTQTNNNQPTNSGGNKGVGNKSMQDYYDEGFMEAPQLAPIFFSRYGISSDASFGTAAVSDSRCKYNFADEVTAIDGAYQHTAIMCNMTGDIYDYKVIQLIDMSQVIGEDAAWEIAVNRILSDKGFDREEINDYSRRIYFSYQNTAPNNYVYNVSFTTKTQGQYALAIDPISGQVLYMY